MPASRADAIAVATCSYGQVASMLDELAAMPDLGGVLLCFDDFIVGTEAFGTHLQPLMQCRQHVLKEIA